MIERDEILNTKEELPPGPWLVFADVFASSSHPMPFGMGRGIGKYFFLHKFPANLPPQGGPRRMRGFTGKTTMDRALVFTLKEEQDE